MRRASCRRREAGAGLPGIPFLDRSRGAVVGTMGRWGWILLPVGLAVAGLVVTSGEGEGRGAVAAWQAPLAGAEGGPAVAWATCIGASRDGRRYVPRHVALTFTGTGQARADDPGFADWLAEKVAELQLACITGQHRGRFTCSPKERKRADSSAQCRRDSTFAGGAGRTEVGR